MKIMSERDHRPDGRFRTGCWEVEPEPNRLCRGEEIVSLEPKTMAVLICLAERAGQLVSADELIEDIWVRHFLAEDPGAVLADVKMPVLAIYGSHDRLTSPQQNAAVLLDGLVRAGNPDVTLRILPQQDHFFLRLPGESVGAHRFGEMLLSPELLDTMRNWLQQLPH